MRTPSVYGCMAAWDRFAWQQCTSATDNYMSFVKNLSEFGFGGFKRDFMQWLAMLRSGKITWHGDDDQLPQCSAK